jgi:tripartite-type tricarboxylate transporter receptor subunit TctC
MISLLGMAFLLSALIWSVLPQGNTAEVYAKDDRSFFKRKTMVLIVSTRPGGDYDFFGRLVAKGLKKHLPGSTVIVKNVPGGGMVIGANEIYKAAPNGLTLGTFNSGIIVAQLTKSPGAKFDLAKYTWLGNAAVFPRFLAVSTKTPLKSIEDLKSAPRPVRFPSSGVGSSAHNDGLMLREILGINIEMIPGYGGARTDMAIMRGDVEGRIGSYPSVMKNVREGLLTPILQWGVKAPDFPEVPFLPEIAPADKKKVASLLDAMAFIGRPFAAPPKMSKKRSQTLREAFEQTLKDPEIVSMAKKAQRTLTFHSGPDVQKKILEVLEQPPEVVAFLKKMVE